LNDQTDAFGLSAIPVPRVDRELADKEEIFIGEEKQHNPFFVF